MVAASVNFPIWRGRVRHSFKYPMLARFARRTGFMDAAYGPSQFYFGELFAIRAHRRADEPRRRRSQRRERRRRGTLARGARRLRLPALLPARDRLGRAPGRRRPATGGRRRRGRCGRDADVGSRRASSRSSSATPSCCARITASRRSTATTTSATRSRTMRLFRGRGRTDPSECDLAVAASNRAGHVYRLASRMPLAEIAGAPARSGPRSTSRPGARTGTPSSGTRAASCGSRPAVRCSDGRGNAWTRRGRPRDARPRGRRRARLRDVSERARAALADPRLRERRRCRRLGRPRLRVPRRGRREPSRRRLARVAARGRLARPAGCGRRRGRPARCPASARSRTSRHLCRAPWNRGPGESGRSYADVLEWPLPLRPH